MSLTSVKYRFCVIDVSHHLFASLSDVRLRRNFEFPEEDLVFVTMKSENSSLGPMKRNGIEKKKQNKKKTTTKKNSSFSSNLCGITGVVWNP